MPSELSPATGGGVDTRILGCADGVLVDQLIALVRCERSRGHAAVEPPFVTFDSVAWLNEHRGVAIAATAGDEVLGGVIAFPVRLLDHPSSELRVHHLVVRPDVRRRGIATRLIQSLKGIAQGSGLGRIVFEVDLLQQPAIACLLGWGSRSDCMRFELSVGP